MRTICCLLVCFIATSLPGQDTIQLFSLIRDRTRDILHGAPQEELPYLRDAYQTRDSFLIEGVRDSTFLFDTSLQPYLDTLMQRIVRKNGVDLQPIVLLDRTWEPNAKSVGSGIFVINLGLLLALELEEELEFVLSHELAHDQLEHHATYLHESAARWEKLHPTLRKLSRPSPFRSQRRQYSLRVALREEFYGTYRAKRAAELQADSLALSYFAELGYPPAFAMSALSQMTRKPVDTLSPQALTNLLDTPEFPLRQEWLTPRPKLFGSGAFGASGGVETTAAFWQVDSLSTHPALPERQAAMATHLVGRSPDKPDDTARPHPHLRAVREALLRGQLDDQAYGLALISALQLLREESTTTHRELVGESLLGVYRATEDHDFDEAVPPVEFFAAESSKAVIRMLRQMNKADLRKLTEAYLSASAPLTYPKARAYFATLPPE